jgi:hypothetical protein
MEYRQAIHSARDSSMDRASFTIRTGITVRGIHHDPTPWRDGIRITRMVAAALLFLMVIGAPGCSLFHHGDSPQQQFMSALNRGDGAQASELWLKMSAKDRSNFSHDIGFKSTPDQDDGAHALIKHQEDQQKKEDADDPDDTSSGDDSDSDSVQVQAPEVPIGVISNLPLYNPQTISAPITEIGPQ